MIVSGMLQYFGWEYLVIDCTDLVFHTIYVRFSEVAIDGNLINYHANNLYINMLQNNISEYVTT
ncbi:hypothetical protein FXO21_04850 [Dyadobacter sp. UC 10]|nr:hypothetical protein FXO21_04850 [Dyadobacter sp. UC 10]